MSNFDKLFTQTTTTVATTSPRQLGGTAQLTALSSELASEVIKHLTENSEDYAMAIEDARVSHLAMDKLVSTIINLDTADTDFINELEDTVIDSMLKSQQSKRSRLKSKVFTLETFKSMVTAAIAEGLIRKATGKSKAAGRKLQGTVEYTAEQLEMFTADQEALKKEIRNIQSKKSIMKSKEGFTTDDERWQCLLAAEETLKSLRTTGRTVVVDETKDKLTTLLSEVQLSQLNANQAHDLLIRIAELTEAVEVINQFEDIEVVATVDDEEATLV